MILWSRRDVVRVVVSTVSAVSSSEIVVTVSLKQKTVIYLHFNSQSNQLTQTEMKISPFWPVSKPDWYFRHRQGGYQGFVSGDDLRLCPQSWWCSLWTRNCWRSVKTGQKFWECFLFLSDQDPHQIVFYFQLLTVAGALQVICCLETGQADHHTQSEGSQHPLWSLIWNISVISVSILASHYTHFVNSVQPGLCIHKFNNQLFAKNIYSTCRTWSDSFMITNFSLYISFCHFSIINNFQNANNRREESYLSF